MRPVAPRTQHPLARLGSARARSPLSSSTGSSLPTTTISQHPAQNPARHLPLQARARSQPRAEPSLVPAAPTERSQAPREFGKKWESRCPAALGICEGEHGLQGRNQEPSRDGQAQGAASEQPCSEASPPAPLPEPSAVRSTHQGHESLLGPRRTRAGPKHQPPPKHLPACPRSHPSVRRYVNPMKAAVLVSAFK